MENIISALRRIIVSYTYPEEGLMWQDHDLLSYSNQKLGHPMKDLDIVEKAAEHGLLHVLQWARRQGYKIETTVCAAAAWNGHLDIIKWVRTVNKSCKNMYVNCGAYCNGHFDVIQWFGGGFSESWSSSIAAANGQLELLKRLNPSSVSPEYVLARGQLQVSKWLLKEKHWSCYTSMDDMDTSNLEYVKWIHENVRLPYNVCAKAAENGHLETVEWLHDKDFISHWHKKSFSVMATSRHWEVLNWACENGYPKEELMFSWAAANGNLDEIKRIHKLGYKWDETLCISAGRNGHVSVLQWALDNLPVRDDVWNVAVYSMAARNGHWNVLKWGLETGCIYGRTRTRPHNFIMPWEILKWAIRGGHTSVLNWLSDNGTEFYPIACLYAACFGNMEVFMWCVRASQKHLTGD